MKTFLAFLLCAVMLFQFSFALADASERTADDYPVPLYTLAEKAGFRIGICLSPNQLGLSAYTSFLTRHFNTTTCTNETKA